MGAIKDGTGTGRTAKVSDDFRLYVDSESKPFQHTIAINSENTYQVLSTQEITGSGRFVNIHMKNISTTKNAVVTFYRQQLVSGSGGFESNEQNYFYVGKNRTYEANGTLQTGDMPVNTSIGSTNTAEVTVYLDNPTLQGTLIEFERYYPKNTDIVIHNKQGAVVIKPQQTIEFGFVTNYSTGSVYTRCSFVMQDISQ